MAKDLFGMIGHGLDSAARRVVSAALVVGACIGAFLWFARDPSPARRMEQASPGWTVDEQTRPPEADDRSGRGQVLLHQDDLGPLRIERIDCAEVRTAFPSWFSLPDSPLGNCARLSGGGSAAPTLVQGIVTPLRLQAIWRPYQASIDRLGLQSSVTFAGRARIDSPDPEPGQEVAESGSMQGSIEPAPGKVDRTVHLLGYRSAGRTKMVFVFRPERR